MERLPPQLELLKEAIPQAARVAVCGTLSILGIRLPSRLRRARRDRWWCSFTASRLQAAEELEGAFTAMTKARADAILVLSDPMTFFHRARIADLAAKRRLPTMHGVRGYVDAGGLIFYWANQADLYRRDASYVDRILKGAKPGHLPIEQPNAIRASHQSQDREGTGA